MSSVFDRLRSGAGRAAFEAEKKRREISIHSAIRSLKEEINQAFYRAGSVASDLHRSGRITQPELLEACEHIAALQAQIVAREREIESIRAETFLEPTAFPRSGLTCPNGHELLPGAQFCPTCGAQAIPAPSPGGGASCPGCGAALIPEAHFCPGCGAPVPEPTPPPPVEPQPQVPEAPVAAPPKATAVTCPSCGAALELEARFCPECGTGIPAPPPPVTPAQQFQTVEESASPAAPATAFNQCLHCGALVDQEAVFCPDCGRHLTPGADGMSQEPIPEESTSPTPLEPPAMGTDEAAEWDL